MHDPSDIFDFLPLLPLSDEEEETARPVLTCRGRGQNKELPSILTLKPPALAYSNVKKKRNPKFGKGRAHALRERSLRHCKDNRPGSADREFENRSPRGLLGRARSQDTLSGSSTSSYSGSVASIPDQFSDHSSQLCSNDLNKDCLVNTQNFVNQLDCLRSLPVSKPAEESGEVCANPSNQVKGEKETLYSEPIFFDNFQFSGSNGDFEPSFEHNINTESEVPDRQMFSGGFGRPKYATSLPYSSDPRFIMPKFSVSSSGKPSTSSLGDFISNAIEEKTGKAVPRGGFKGFKKVDDNEHFSHKSGISNGDFTTCDDFPALPTSTKCPRASDAEISVQEPHTTMKGIASKLVKTADNSEAKDYSWMGSERNISCENAICIKNIPPCDREMFSGLVEHIGLYGVVEHHKFNERPNGNEAEFQMGSEEECDWIIECLHGEAGPFPDGTKLEVLKMDQREQ